MNWKEFLNWCRIHEFSVSIEKEIPYGRRVEVEHRRDKVIVNYYDSGKYSLQGKESLMKEKLQQILGLPGSSLIKDNNDYLDYAGSDESGKGDYFGPLVVVACFVPDKNIKKVRALGVQDSKKIKDPKIRTIAASLQDLCDFEVISFMPLEYNFIYQEESNLNHLLSSMHKDAHMILKKRVSQIKGIIIDQFTSKEEHLKSALSSLNLPVTQKIRAEAYLPVACASVLARALFVEGLEELSRKWDMHFPKGASLGVEQAALKFIELHGAEKLKEVAKMHFVTSKKIGL